MKPSSTAAGWCGSGMVVLPEKETEQAIGGFGSRCANYAGKRMMNDDE